MRLLLVSQVLDILTLPFVPIGFRRDVCVSASLDDRRHALTEPTTDLSETALATCILHGVVQQGRDRFILVRAVLQGDASDRQQVTDVRDSCSLLDLSRVENRRIRQSLLEPG